MRMLPIGHPVTVQYQSSEFHQLSNLLRQQKVDHIGTVLVFTGMAPHSLEAAANRFAADLGMSISRINLQKVTSKYIGETEKNLQRLLGSAAAAHTILLFDEADALFGNRTSVKDAHDRYDNLDTNYLLELLESYKGILVILAHPSGKAITRRSKGKRVVVRFPPR